MIPPDRQAPRLYEAEIELRELIDTDERFRALEERGMTLEETREYVAQMCQRWGMDPLDVDVAAGEGAGYCYPEDRIFLPGDHDWAYRQIVLTHECAHHWMVHYTEAIAERAGEDIPTLLESHGREFCAVLLAFVRCELGPTASELLEHAYRRHAVRWDGGLHDFLVAHDRDRELVAA